MTITGQPSAFTGWRLIAFFMLDLDHNATTPIRPEVLAEVQRVSGAGYGNPSSLHGAGRAARSALEECREKIASSLGARSGKIVFTSGGTESNRLAILGILPRGEINRNSAAHAVVSSIDHPSTIDPYRNLQEEGLSVTWVSAGPDGRVDPEEVVQSIQPQTRIVSVLHSNNETGVIQEIGPIARSCRSRGIPFHCDAVQSLGKIPLRLNDLGADLVSLSAHKIGGPKGVGALWIRSGIPFHSPHGGGPQEWGWRPGTENLPGVTGFACAVERMAFRGPELRDRLLGAIQRGIPWMVLNGHPDHLLPNTLNISFPGVQAELLLIRLDLEGLAASSGSACASGAHEPSHVLQAMGLSPERIESAVRFSLGWTNTTDEIDRAGEIISRVVKELGRRGNSDQNSSEG